MYQPTATKRAPQDVSQPRKTVSRWVSRGGPAVLAATLVLYLAVYLRWPTFVRQIDVEVYRFGAMRVSQGLDLYASGLTGRPDSLLFVYSPFAALCFVPLIFLTQRAVELVWLVSMAVLVTYAVARMLRWLGLTAATGLWSLTALLVGVVAWLQPVRLSIQLGQINVAILAVVVADLLAPQQRRWAGIGVGLVAGIKLTPAIFILYLVVIGRLRAAVVATATLAATIVAGFAVLPADSRYYWLNRGFADSQRISADPVANTAVAGMLQRLHYPAALGIGVATVLVLAGLAVGAIAHRRGHGVLAIGIVGLSSAAASPFSWNHHWVWFAPLVVHLGYRGYVLGCRYSAWAMWLMCALLASWFTSFSSESPDSGVISLRPGGMWDDVVPGFYVVVFVVVLIGTAAWLWRSAPVVKTTSEKVPPTATFTSAEVVPW